MFTFPAPYSLEMDMQTLELSTINPRGKGTSWAQKYPLNSRDYLLWFPGKMQGNMYEHVIQMETYHFTTVEK